MGGHTGSPASSRRRSEHAFVRCIVAEKLERAMIELANVADASIVKTTICLTVVEEVYPDAS